MDRTELERYMEPPPRWADAAESLPHLGGLALAPYRGELPDEIELHAVEACRDAFDDETARALLKRTLGHAKVRERLGRARHMPIGVSRRFDKGQREGASSHLVVVYDYSANVAVEISLDARGEVSGVADAAYQPALVEAEVARAIEIARADERLPAQALGSLVGMVIPYGGPGGEWADRRVVEVLFGCRSERLPRFRAWVDLSTETVLQAGDGCGCCGAASGEQR